ncbi:MAG: hypothetical protein P4L40_17045 [Terracidiphilus sp.]|nr:hypothetical protein [Terracidiphilus sp.]
MSLVKKSDVKNHLSPRHHKDIHLYQPDIQQDATGFVVENSGPAGVTLDQRIGDALNQSGSIGTATAPFASDLRLESVVVPVASQSASE